MTNDKSISPVIRSIYYGHLDELGTPYSDYEAFGATADVQCYIRKTTYTTRENILEELVRRLQNGEV